MTTDLQAAGRFMAGSGRLLDRRRFDLLTGTGDGAGVLGAVEGYRNPDGGFGWGLEPDLRDSTSQPAGALHAFEAIADAGPLITPRAVELCDWLESATLPDGGLPFALPVADATACAPFWAGADPRRASLQITSYVAAAAHRVARHDPAVAGHPWLASATDWCLASIAALEGMPHALVLVASVGLAGAIAEARPEDSAAALERLAAHLPADGIVHVAGGRADEVVRPLDFAPEADSPARSLFAREVLDGELERLAAQQEEDGGWTVGFDSYSTAAALEWRGYATVRAVGILRGAGWV